MSGLGVPVEFRSLFHGSAAGTIDFFLQPGLFLLRAEEEWVRCWTAMMSGRRPDPDVPAVRWGSELVVVLALGWRPTTGYSVTIEQLTVSDRELRVSAREARPDGYVGDLVTSPVHAVAMPVHDIGGDLHLVQRITTSS